MKKIILLYGSLITTLVSFGQTATISGNVQTDIEGDYSGIEIFIENKTTNGSNSVTEEYTIFTDENGNYSFDIELYENTFGIGPEFLPALLNITYSKTGFEIESITNFSIDDPQTYTIDNMLLFTEGIEVYTPEICMVRVSNITGLNNIVWDRPAGMDIEKYYVFKQVDNDWISYDTVMFDSLSVCADYSTELSGSEFYQLQAVFNDGRRSAYSDSYKAPFVNVSTEFGVPKIEWLKLSEVSRLDPSKIEKIYMYRGLDKASLELFDSIVVADINMQNPAESLSARDNTLPTSGIYFYQIGFKLFTDCTPSQLKSESGPFSIALSNIAESEYITVVETSINQVDNSVSINSDNNSVIIKTNKAESYSISTIDGKFVTSGIINGEAKIALDKGVYIISTLLKTQKIIIK